MGKFNEYSQKATPADNDTMMIYDAASKSNKLSPFSGIWNWIVGKLTNAVISNLQTSNKTVLGAINELNSKASNIITVGNVSAGSIGTEFSSIDEAAQYIFDSKIPSGENKLILVNFIFGFQYCMIAQKYYEGKWGAYILFGCNVPNISYHVKTDGKWK